MFNIVDGQKLAEFKREKYSNVKKNPKIIIFRVYMGDYYY